jgi:hypothetical protein
VVTAVKKALFRIENIDPGALVKARYERYRRIGTHVAEGATETNPG